MSYTCSLCHKEINGDLLNYIDHTEKHIVDEIKSIHPEWVEDDGVCRQCVKYFKNQLKGKEK